jgi:hypothetical protein
MATGDFYEVACIRTATLVAPVFGERLAHSTASRATRTATRVDPIVVGGGYAHSTRSVATRTATDVDTPAVGGVGVEVDAIASIATRTATRPVAVTDNAKGSTNSIATRTATNVTATVQRYVGSFVSLSIREATEVRAVVGDPPDSMLRDRPRRFENLDQTHIWPKGGYLIRAGAALSRQGIAAVPLVVGLPFLGFAIVRSDTDETTVAVQPFGVCDLDVEGAGTPAANGRTVYALHADRFTLSAGGTPIGRVVAWRYGRRCRVFFEAQPFRSL